MLTKEECDKALDRVARFCSWFSPYKYPECIKLKNELDILSDLIEEHFSNPPLKFEELKGGMWIWDKEEEEWLWLCAKRKENDIEYLRVHSIYECDSVCKFEPNRFFRKEVQE